MGRTCVWSPCPVLILTHPGPPSPGPPHWNHNILMLVWTWYPMNWCQSKGHQPEVALLAIIFLHGIQGAHSSVLFQTHAIRKKVFSWSFSGRRQQGPHHDLAETRRKTHLKEIRNEVTNNRWSKYCCTCRCTQGQSLHNMSNGLNPPIGDDRHPETSGVLCNLVHRGTLGPPACHHCTCLIGYKLRLVSDSEWCEKPLIIKGFTAVYLPGWCRWSHSPCPPSEHPHQRQSGFSPVQLSPLERDRGTEMRSVWEPRCGTL